MTRRTLALALSSLFVVVLAGCGGAEGDRPGELDVAAPSLTGAQARPAAPVAAGALAKITDGSAVRGRIGYVNVAALDRAKLPVPASQVIARVLGRGAKRLGTLDTGAASTAVQLGADVTLLRGPGLDGIEGRRSGSDGVVVGASEALALRLADTTPERSAITPAAQSAVQSCLGETLAETILGPATMGSDAALGIGIAESHDDPAGIQLRVCGAPRYVRHVHAMERTLRKRFGAVADGTSRIGEQEIGEREIVSGVIAADGLQRSALLDLLAAGPELRALAWR